MSAEDRFEEELVTRLGAHAAGVTGNPPLAELREAGRRRARRQAAVRAVTAAAVLAVGAGALTQLGSLGSGRTGAAGLGVGAPSPTPGATARGQVSVMLNCTNGPTSMRTPGWHQHPSQLPWGPSSSGRPSSGAPTSGTPSSSGRPSSGAPTSGTPSSSGQPSSGAPTPSGSQTAWPTFSGSPTAWPTASGSPSAPLSADPVETGVTRAGQTIEDMGMTDYSDHYFGTCRDRSTNTLYVMRVPGSGLDAAVARTAADWPTVKVQFADAAGSRGQLMALLNRIRADTEEWRAKGVTIEGLTLAIDGAGIVVDTPQWQSAEAEIKARYGPLVAEVR